MTLDPIHQFNINSFFTIGHIGGHTIAFTNSSAYMLLTVAVICLLAVRGMVGRQLVPGRFQSAAELSYVFVAHHDPLHRRRGWHEVLPAGVLGVHVYFGREPD